MNAQIFEQTPQKLAEYVANINVDGIGKADKLNIADLMCGNGCITIQIAEKYPNSTIYAFDINPDRIYAAKELYGDRN